MQKRSLTVAVLTALGAKEEDARIAREAVRLTRQHAREHGWRSALAAWVSPEKHGHG